MTTWLIIFAVGVPLLALIIGIATRPEPIRNGYQLRQRTRIKGGRTVILEPKDDPRIVGDGAWNPTAKAEYPKSARIADMQEPRGY